MKDFVLSVVASLLASVIFLAFSVVSSTPGLIILSAVLCGLLALFSLYLIIANRCSKNTLKGKSLEGCKVGVEGRDDLVVFEKVSLLRPNYIKFRDKDGNTGLAHYLRVIVFI